MASTSEDATTCDVQRQVPRRIRVDSPHPLVEGPPPDAGQADEQPATATSHSDEPIEADSLALLELEEPTPELLAVVRGQTLDAQREQLQLQVSQLAGHLRERLRDVDRREAQLHARQAQLDADLRASRLWVREREEQFQEREADLLRQIEQLTEQLNTRGLEELLPGVESRAEEISDRQREIELREREARERRMELEREASALRHAQQVWEQQRATVERDLARQRTDMAQEFAIQAALREEQLRVAEQMIAQHAERLDADRAALLAERQAWEAQRDRQQQALAGRQEELAAELADRHQRLAARQEWIERERLGLTRMRDEVLGLHRQSLEMRLIAEQLWSQISSRLSPAEVTQSIGQLKRKLSDHYRLEEQSVAAKKEELLALAERLTTQHQELVQLRSGLREWAAARQAEIDEQSQSLAERELAADEQRESFRHAEQAWNADRRRYEQQLRELTSQLRTLPAAA